MIRATVTVLCLFVVAPTMAEDDPAKKWEEAIQKFLDKDEQSPSEANGVLFVGSSSIRLWDTEKFFPKANVLNRGFGGSMISDVNYYVEPLVLKHRPRVIVFYAGDNDISKGKSSDQVFSDYQAFLATVQKALPKTHVVFIPIKPSLKRWAMWEKMNAANQKIRQVCGECQRWHYVDTATPMFGEDGKPMADLLQEDQLHLSEKGYGIWSRLVNRKLQQVDRILGEKPATGVVFEDLNGNRKLDPSDQRLEGVRVSNGRDVVLTNADGVYELTVDEDDILFVIKPRGYRTPLDENKLPQFYYIHKPAGSPPQRFPGVEPTGPLPSSIDFPLYKQKEPEKFKAIMFGDPQPRDQKEVDYIAHDVVEELLGTDASFGVTLGDIVLMI